MTTVGRYTATPVDARRDRTQRFTVSRDDAPVAQDAAFTDLGGDLGALFTDIVRSCPYEAVFFETPRLSGRPLELVLADSPTLAARSPEPEPFAHEMDAADVATFPNLGGDAWLVVPSARGPHAAYTHLATFVRGAPPDQVQALWAEAGHAITRWRTTRNDPLWFSTSGLGVSWVHLRLDQRPKYITYPPYRSLMP